MLHLPSAMTMKWSVVNWIWRNKAGDSGGEDDDADDDENRRLVHLKKMQKNEAEPFSRSQAES